MLSYFALVSRLLNICVKGRAPQKQQLLPWRELQDITQISVEVS